MAITGTGTRDSPAGHLPRDSVLHEQIEKTSSRRCVAKSDLATSSGPWQQPPNALA
jgi:hypothetical protein